MNSLPNGSHYLLEGFRLITQPGLKRFVIFPLLINILLFLGLFFVLIHFMGAFNAWVMNLLPNWLQWLSYALWLVFFAAFFLVLLYTFVTIANIIAAPFNSLLAEKVENHLTGTIVPEQSTWAFVKDVPRSIGKQFGVLAYYFPRALLFLLLFFIPLIHFIAPPIWFLFNAWVMAMTYVDYPCDNHRFSFAETLGWLKANRWSGFGFGISVLVATMIPFVNFFAMPAAVAGATKFWVEEGKPKKIASVKSNY